MNYNFDLYNYINKVIEDDNADSINIVSFGGIYKDELKDFFDIYLKDLFLESSVKEDDKYIFYLKDIKNKKDYVMNYSLIDEEFYIIPKKYLDDFIDLSFDNYEEVLFDNKRIVSFKDNELCFLNFSNLGLFYNLYNYSLNKDKTIGNFNGCVRYYDALKMLKNYKSISDKNALEINNKVKIDGEFIKNFSKQLEGYFETKKVVARASFSNIVFYVNNEEKNRIPFNSNVSVIKNCFSEFNKFEVGRKVSFDIISKYLKCDLNLYLDEILRSYDFINIEDNKKIMVNVNDLSLYKIEVDEDYRILPLKGNVSNKNNIISLVKKDNELIYFEFACDYVMVENVFYDSKFNIDKISAKYYDSSILYYLMSRSNINLYDAIYYFINNYEDLINNLKLIPDDEVVALKKDISMVSVYNGIGMSNFIEYYHKQNDKNKTIYISSFDDKNNVLEVHRYILEDNCKKYVKSKN